MNKLDFKLNLLSPKYVKENEILYDESIFYSKNKECKVFLDKTPELGRKQFTGLPYELDMNGTLRYHKYYR